MEELKPTYGKFTTIGIVTGLDDKSFSEGKKNEPWARLRLNIKTSKFSFVYVELMGVQHSNVKLIHRDPITKKYDKDNTVFTNWDERYYIRNDHYDLHMPIRINLKDEQELLPYDAVFYLKENLTEGDLVYIKGNIQYSEYEKRSRINFHLTAIDRIKDISTIEHKPVISFEQECVFVNTHRDHEKLLIDTYIIRRNSGEMETILYTFTARDLNLIRFFETEIKYGSLIKIHGYIHNRAITSKIDGYPVITKVIKELEVKGGHIVEMNKYTKDDLNIEDKGEIIFVSPDETDDGGFGFPF